jgi:DNA-binding response OmpR family regulator
MRILLVDDEKELVSTLAERLALRGVEADWVVSAEEALIAVERCPYEVAVLDVRIPRMSGLNLKKLIQERCPKMRFIFMTGHGSEADFMTGVAEAGLGNYLVKPVKIEVLLEKIREATQEKGGQS